MPPLDRHQISVREGGAGSISKLCNNKLRILGPEWSMSKVGTFPPHNLYKPRRLVASNTVTQLWYGSLFDHLLLYMHKTRMERNEVVHKTVKY